MSEEKIIGWKNLEDYLNRCEHVIRRLIAYYDFPKNDLIMEGNITRAIWNKSDVDVWLKDHELPKGGSKKRKLNEEAQNILV